jgi:hypothetical protein
VFASIATLATPGYLYVRFLQQRVWPNSPRAVTWSRNVAMVVSVGVCAYASTYLLGRLFDLALGDGDGPDGWGRVAPWVIGLAAGAAAWFTRARRRAARGIEVPGSEYLAAPGLTASTQPLWSGSGVTRR